MMFSDTIGAFLKWRVNACAPRRWFCRMDAVLAVLALAIFGLDLLLPGGQAIIILLILVIILAGRSGRASSVVMWCGISLILGGTGYFMRHGWVFHFAYFARRGVCLLSFIAAAIVVLRSQWLEQAQAERASVLGKAMAPMLVRDPAGIITAWSDGAERLYGWSAAEAIGRSAAAVFGEDAPRTSADNPQAAEKCKGESLRRTADGRMICVLYHWAVQRDRQGKVLAILESATDITELKALEAKLRESEAHFRRVFEMAGTAIWAEDYGSAGQAIQALRTARRADAASFEIAEEIAVAILATARVDAMNRAAEQLFGRNAAALQSRPTGSLLLHCGDAPAQFLLALIEGKRAFSCETRISPPNAGQRRLLVSATVEFADGAPGKALITAFDMTDRKQAEEDLASLQTRLSQIARSATLGELNKLVGNRLETPLATIAEQSRAASAMLESGADPVSAIAGMLQAVICDAKYASSVVADVRSMIQRSRETRLTPRLAAVIETIFGLLEREFLFYGITPRLDIRALPEGGGDVSWLEPIVTYLLLKCIQAMTWAERSKRCLSVSAFMQGSEFILLFQAGIDPVLGSFDPLGLREMDGTEDSAWLVCGASVRSHGGRILSSGMSGRSMKIAILLPR